jgi:hypothetical protein
MKPRFGTLLFIGIASLAVVSFFIGKRMAEYPHDEPRPTR